MLILGIDPGTTKIGYGTIQKEGGEYRHINSGLISLSSKKKGGAERLLEIEKRIKKLVNEAQPDVVGIEKLFFSKNKKTAIRVAEARGVIISALAKSGAKTVEMTPTEVKSAVTGNGNASKDAVAKMVGYFLNQDVSDMEDDVTDALAIAISAGDQGSRI